MVTVAFSASSSCASGLPTMLERPTTTAFIPASEACTVFARRMQPSGVQGTSDGRPVDSRPAFIGWKPSTSLAGSIASITFSESICAGSGSCTRMPCTAESALSLPHQRQQFGLASSPPAAWWNDRMPAPTVCRVLLRT